MSSAPPFFKATTPDGRWAVIVELEPPTKDFPGEWFSCLVVRDGVHVTESLLTDQQSKMLRWVKRQMKTVMQRSVSA